MPGEASVFRPGGVSYLRIPAPDPPALAGFYAEVFGWSTSPREGSVAFSDATGHVIGHFVADQAVAGEDGVRPYVHVERVADAVAAVRRCGGRVVTEAYREGDLLVATVADPAGNVIGVWQRR